MPTRIDIRRPEPQEGWQERLRIFLEELSQAIAQEHDRKGGGVSIAEAMNTGPGSMGRWFDGTVKSHAPVHEGIAVLAKMRGVSTYFLMAEIFGPNYAEFHLGTEDKPKKPDWAWGPIEVERAIAFARQVKRALNAVQIPEFLLVEPGATDTKNSKRQPTESGGDIGLCNLQEFRRSLRVALASALGIDDPDKLVEQLTNNAELQEAAFQIVNIRPFRLISMMGEGAERPPAHYVHQIWYSLDEIGKRPSPEGRENSHLEGYDLQEFVYLATSTHCQSAEDATSH